MSSASALSTKLQRAAASIGVRGGHSVPLNYGSAAGELALCMRSVGLVDREDLRVLAIKGEASELDRITGGRFEGGLRLGEARTIGRTHWGRIAAEEAVVISAAGPSLLLLAELEPELVASPASISESSLVAIGIIGPAARGLLVDLGAYGALNGVTGKETFTDGFATWMVLDDAFALALVEPARAVPTWDAITTAGRRFELGYVGAEAAERFELTHCPSPRPDRVLL